MGRILAIALCVALLGVMVWPTGAATADDVVYELKTWPAHRLRGVNINLDGSPCTREDLRHLAQEWGANHVRIQIFTGGVPEGFGETDGASQAYLKSKVDPVLTSCRELGLSAVLDCHGAPGNPRHWSDRPLWDDFKWHDNFENLWREMAAYYRENTTIVGYELLNEPNMRKQTEGTPSDWSALAKRLTAAIREVDDLHTIVVGPPNWSNPKAFAGFEPTGDPNTIYTLHMYSPNTFTHQGVKGSPIGIPYPRNDGGLKWDKDMLASIMDHAAEFQRQHGLPRMYAGEFSAIVWAPGDSALNYLRDVLAYFEEHEWDWAYHAYREWQGWSLEHAGTGPDDLKPVESTDRLDLFLRHFAKNGTD